MTIGQINGYPVYMVTSKEVNSTPSAFLQAFNTWEEGAQKSQLSNEELNALKQKYNSNKLSDKETIELFGDLVKAGVLSKAHALNIYNGAIPIDVSNYNGTSQGTLTKCNANAPAWGRPFGSKADRGYSEFKSTFEEIKRSSSGQSESSSYVKSYDGFLKIMEQLRRKTIRTNG